MPEGLKGKDAVRWNLLVARWGLMACAAGVVADLYGQQPAVQPTLTRFCLPCHNSRLKTAGLELEPLLREDVAAHTAIWEKVVRRLRARMMPPAGAARPAEDVYDRTVSALESALDHAAAAAPDPGRTATFRRLTRIEYQNAIRDLLAVEIDVAALLPADESSHGFDNVTVGDLSPTLLDRYVQAAEKISRLAIGSAGRAPAGDTIRIPPDLTQEEHIAGLPLGTRGGALIRYSFPADGEYEIQIRLSRDRNEHVEGLTAPHELEILVDRQRLALFTLVPPRSAGEHATADQHLKSRVFVKAGPRQVGVAFLKNPSLLLETARQPFQARFNMHRHPRTQPAVYSISITGPFQVQGASDTPSRKRIFLCRPKAPAEEEGCAQTILAGLMRRAYRRPVSGDEVRRALSLYRQGRAQGGFDSGIELALTGLLISPEFLFRIEQDPAGLPPKTAYRISPIELASRLSFFLWSSIPDEPLLASAESGALAKSAELERQVRRMLADSRARALVTNFAAQWLHLRNLDSATPDMRLFPDFDDNLRQALRQETELLFESIVNEDRSVLELLRARYTFLNERLAKHYGIPNIYGSRFRRVELDEASHRGGLLRHGSILTVTSYATRTSPVIRGKWVLENLIGVPPPPPPAAVPALKENTTPGKTQSVRERLAEHRANPACAGCHQLMDPLGFAFENYDAVGRWRMLDDGRPIDDSGAMPGSGSEFTGVSGLEQALLSRPEVFVGVLTEKLLTYALGRGVEHYDMPALRKIVRNARAHDYRFSAIIREIVNSLPFQMRRSP